MGRESQMQTGTSWTPQQGCGQLSTTKAIPADALSPVRSTALATLGEGLDRGVGGWGLRPPGPWQSVKAVSPSTSSSQLTESYTHVVTSWVPGMPQAAGWLCPWACVRVEELCMCKKGRVLGHSERAAGAPRAATCCICPIRLSHRVCVLFALRVMLAPALPCCVLCHAVLCCAVCCAVSVPHRCTCCPWQLWVCCSGARRAGLLVCCSCCGCWWCCTLWDQLS